MSSYHGHSTAEVKSAAFQRTFIMIKICVLLLLSAVALVVSRLQGKLIQSLLMKMESRRWNKYLLLSLTRNYFLCRVGSSGNTIFVFLVWTTWRFNLKLLKCVLPSPLQQIFFSQFLYMKLYCRDRGFCWRKTSRMEVLGWVTEPEDNVPCNTDHADVRSFCHFVFLSMTRVSFLSSFADTISDVKFLLSRGHNFLYNFLSDICQPKMWYCIKWYSSARI